MPQLRSVPECGDECRGRGLAPERIDQPGAHRIDEIVLEHCHRVDALLARKSQDRRQDEPRLFALRRVELLVAAVRYGESEGRDSAPHCRGASFRVAAVAASRGVNDQHAAAPRAADGGENDRVVLPVVSFEWNGVRAKPWARREKARHRDAA